MTTTLRARVYRDLHPESVFPWQVEIELPGTGPSTLTTSACGAAPSHPEALQLAYMMLRDLDRELMEDVHRSRSARRPTPTTPDIHTMEATA